MPSNLIGTNQPEATSQTPLRANLTSISASRLQPASPAVSAALQARAVGLSGDNPFESLPFPNPGDRIKAEDFRALSQSLLQIRDVFAQSGALFGQTFGQAKLTLVRQQYEIERAMTVFGTEIANLEDESLDNRKVIQVLPIQLGERRVTVILSEAVETRRFAPNLMGLTYKEASERLRGVLGDVTFPSTPKSATQLIGLTLAVAKDILSK